MSLRKTLDRFLELGSEEPPGAAQLAAGQDAAAGELLDCVRLEVQESGDVRDGQHILTRNAGAESTLS